MTHPDVTALYRGQDLLNRAASHCNEWLLNESIRRPADTQAVRSLNDTCALIDELADWIDMELLSAGADLDQARVYYDDWLVDVLLPNGQVYVFCTEMWPEHGDDEPYEGFGDDHNWDAVIAAAKDYALDLSDRGAEPYATVSPAALPDRDSFYAFMSRVCEQMSDEDFRRLVRS